MRYVNFGSTGLKISEVGFGGIPIIRLGQAEAVEVLRRAYDRGITFTTPPTRTATASKRWASPSRAGATR